MPPDALPERAPRHFGHEGALDDNARARIEALLAPDDEARRARAERPNERAPVHVVYGGAHLFRADTAAKLGRLAVRTLDEHAPDAASFARAIGVALPPGYRDTLHARVLEKLSREPVEDLRIDFEDGYGVRPDEEEDAAAASAARELARGVREASLPPFVGIRVKAFAPETRARALRTLEIFLSAFAAERAPLPPRFCVTLPKIDDARDLEALDVALTSLEAALGFAPGAVAVEAMIETTRALANLTGERGAMAFERAAGGRLVAAHFGAYDYTAAAGVSAHEQRMTHPACDFARDLMQLAFAGTRVRLSDGATNVLPVDLHKAPPGAALSDEEREDNRTSVHRAFRLHHDHIRRALARGFYQGWDLHPAQLPVRYAATYAFFLEGMAESAARLRAFVGRAAQATLAGAVFDDAATGQGLLEFFLRATSAGALTSEEVFAATGVPEAALRTRSFAAIVRMAREHGGGSAAT